MTQCRCSTATLPSPADDLVVLRVAGEVDLTNAALLDTALDDVLDRRPDHLGVDLTALTFCGARGLSAVARSARVGAQVGTGYTIGGASPPFVRLWPLFWSDREVPPRIHATTAAAVLAAVALQARRWSPAHPSHVPRTTGDDTDLLGRSTAPAGDHDAVAIRQALQSHRNRMYRAAVHALGGSYGAGPLAPWPPTSPHSTASPSAGSPTRRRRLG